MSAKTTDQKTDIQPRKKKKTKRKANSPLIDTEHCCEAGGVNNGQGKVSSVNSSFIFPNPQNKPAMMNFSQQGPFSQGTPLFGAGSAYPTPSHSPNQMSSYNMPPPLASGPPNWATELMNDVKQIKVSLGKLDQIEKTVNLINSKVSDLETKVNSMEPRINTVENSCSFMSDENEDRKKDLARAKSDLKNYRTHVMV